jgi:hypothetical protein
MGTQSEQQEEAAVNAMVDESMKRAQDLLRAQVAAHGRPFEAFVTMTLAVSALAKSMDMPRGTLLEGVGAAFDSLEPVHVH